LKLQKNAERSLKKETNLLRRLSQFSAHFLFPVSLFYAMIYRSVLVRRSRRHKQKAASLVAMHSTLRPGTVFDLQPDNGDELAMTSLKVRSDVEAARKTSSTPGTANNAACLADEVQNIEQVPNIGEVPKIDEIQNIDEVPNIEEVQNIEEQRRSVVASAKLTLQERYRMANLRTAAMLFVVTAVFVITFLPASLISSAPTIHRHQHSAVIVVIIPVISVTIVTIFFSSFLFIFSLSLSLFLLLFLLPLRPTLSFVFFSSCSLSSILFSFFQRFLFPFSRFPFRSFLSYSFRSSFFFLPLPSRVTDRPERFNAASLPVNHSATCFADDASPGAVPHLRLLPVLRQQRCQSVHLLVHEQELPRPAAADLLSPVGRRLVPALARTADGDEIAARR